MKKFFCNDIKNILNFIPLTLSFGILTGVDAYYLILGIVIASFIGIFFNKSYLLFPSVALLSVIGGVNSYLSGDLNKLYAIFFVSSLVVIFLTFLKFSFKLSLKKAFLFGIYLSLIIILIPPLFGHKTYTTALMTLSGIDLFSYVNEQTVALSFLTFALYSYMNKIKNGFVPKIFLTLLVSALAAYVFNLNVDLMFTGDILISPKTAHFTPFIFILFAGLVIGAVQSYINFIFALKKKDNLSLGISSLISSFFGATPSNIAYTGFVALEFIISGLFLVFFDKIVKFIPVCSICAIGIYYAFKYLILLSKALKSSSLYHKIFSVPVILSILYNPFFGVIFTVVIGFIYNKIILWKRK